MRRLLISLLLGVISLGLLNAQTLVQRLEAPVFYELGIQPGFQTNPLNLSHVELEKADEDPDYLNGIMYSSSNMISIYAKLNYAPRLLGERKTRLNLQVFQHYYHDIPERSYQTYSFSLKQSMGHYRYLHFGYWILPEYYLRNYRFKDPLTHLTTRQATRFGTDRIWIGFQHRLTHLNRLEYRLSLRQELYQAPFAHFDLQMQEAMIRLSSRQFKTLQLNFELQYGLAENDNQIDQVDRSYRYLNLRPSFTIKMAGKHGLRLAGRYEQRAYNSEQLDDPLHTGRYQEEFRLDLVLLPKLTDAYVMEPFVGYRARRVDSSDPAIRDLKSYSRVWFGIRLGFKSVIDMYF